MVRFVDGPAAGQALALRRAPVFLRAVRASDGTWDALDQLTDTPRPNETIAVYRRTGLAHRVHINAGRSGCFWTQLAEYRVVDSPPADGIARNTASWREWCSVHGDDEGAEEQA
jgi:hypothetical protein